MKALVMRDNGPQIEDVREPDIKPTEIKVKVEVASLNRHDLLVTSGHAHIVASTIGSILGIEWAGVVLEVGAAVPASRGIKVGGRVMCSGRGGYAEVAVADWGRVYPIPDALADNAAAAVLPVSLQTAHAALVGDGKLEQGQSVLVTGATSSVGLMMLQVAKFLGATAVYGTSTSRDRAETLMRNGATRAFNTSSDAWETQVLDATDNKGVDLVVDMVSGPVINPVLRATRVGGRIVNVGRLGGEISEFNFDTHAERRLTYIGASFRTRSLDHVRDITTKTHADLWSGVASGELQLPIAGRFPLVEYDAAVALMRDGARLGKIVLSI